MASAIRSSVRFAVTVRVVLFAIVSDPLFCRVLAEGPPPAAEPIAGGLRPWSH